MKIKAFAVSMSVSVSVYQERADIKERKQPKVNSTQWYC